MLWLRAIAFGCCAGFIVLAPAYTQLFAGSLPLPRWQMFRDIALEVHRVRFEAQAPGGPRRELDRYRVLGHVRPLRAPSTLRWLTSEAEARALASHLCAHLGADERLFMHLDRATLDGWQTLNDGRRDVCQGDPVAVRESSP
jgi:hypothetical protein